MAAVLLCSAVSLFTFSSVETRADGGFSDVTDPGKAIYEPIYWMAEEGLTKGFPDGTFRPKESVTREQFVTFLWRMAGRPEQDAVRSGFSDVTVARPTFQAIQWAVEEGIINGFEDGTFRPEDPLIRQHVAIMLWRMAGKPESSEYTMPFEDVSAPANSDTYKAIAWGYSTGITKGFDATHFVPSDSVNRKDTLIMLYRLAGKPDVLGEMTYQDVQEMNLPANSDTYKAILWAQQAGITKGYTDGTFKPYSECLREQIVTFLYRYNNYTK